MSAFLPGDVIETTRAMRIGSSWSLRVFATPERFVVAEVHGAAGFLVVVPEGQLRRRYVNEYAVETRDARLPAPGELAEEYGR